MGEGLWFANPVKDTMTRFQQELDDLILGPYVSVADPSLFRPSGAGGEVTTSIHNFERSASRYSELYSAPQGRRPYGRSAGPSRRHP